MWMSGHCPGLADRQRIGDRWRRWRLRHGRDDRRGLVRLDDVEDEIAGDPDRHRIAEGGGLADGEPRKPGEKPVHCPRSPRCRC